MTDAPTTAGSGETVAGVDLGSNSFHMVVARPDHGQLNVLDKVRERVRLAATLSRSRNTEAPPPLTLAVKKDRFRLTFPRGWLEAHPLTRADVEEEAARLEAVGLQLVCGS